MVNNQCRSKVGSFWVRPRNKVLEYGSLWALVLEYGPEVIIFFRNGCISISSELAAHVPNALH